MRPLPYLHCVPPLIFLAALWSIGCQTELNLEERTYPCSVEAECPEAYRCTFSQAHARKVCTPPPDAGSADTTEFLEPTKPIALAAGSDHNCVASSDNSVRCWGRQDRITIVADDYVDVAANGATTCGINDEQQIHCWGTLPEDFEPPAGSEWGSIAVGPGSVCGLAAGGDISCAGEIVDTWDGPPGPGPYRDISVGMTHWCAVTDANGEVVCGGSNISGQGTPPAGAKFETVSAGHHHSCGTLSTGLIECWGSPPDGAPIPPGVFEAVRAGTSISCGRSADGSVACWGAQDTLSESSVPSGARFVAIDCGSHHCCGISTSDKVHCWGKDSIDRRTRVPSGFR